MNGDVIDQDVAERGIDLIPFIRSKVLPPQYERFSLGEGDVVVIPAFPSHCDDVGPHLWHRVAHIPKRVGDDPCPCTRGDLEERMAKPFDLHRA